MFWYTFGETQLSLHVKASQSCVKVLTSTMSVDAKCEESLTLWDVCSSILQAYRGFINGEPFTSESEERNFDRTDEGTYEHPYQLKYESTWGQTKLLETSVARPISPWYPLLQSRLT